MEVSAIVTERHNYATAGLYKFFGEVTIDGARYAFSATLDGAAFAARLEGETRECIVRPALLEAVRLACQQFAARCH